MRTILITGCSSGIGHHAAHALKDRGWRVFATCRKDTDAARLRSEGLESFRLDYEDPASIEAGLNDALARSDGRLDALFNNGAYAIPAAVEDLPEAALQQIFQANLFGWHALTRRVIPVMRAQGHGRIVNCSSVLGLTAMPWRGAYVATKYALEGLTDTLRVEMRDTPIDIVLIEPGPIGTAFRLNARKQFDRWIDWQASPRAEQYRNTLVPRLYKAAEASTPDPFELGPEAVTAKLIKALESPRPRARYFVTTPTYAAAIARRILPQRLIDRMIAKA